MIVTLLRKPQTASLQGCLNLEKCRVGGGEVDSICGESRGIFDDKDEKPRQ